MDIYSVMERMSRCTLVAGYYHLLGDSSPLHTKHIYACKTLPQFERDLDFLLSRYGPIEAADLIRRVRNGADLPRRSLLLTFDDGLREAYDLIAPALLRRGVPAVFFVSTAFLDNASMSYDHKRSLVIERLLSCSPAEAREVAGVLKIPGGTASAVLESVRGLAYGDQAVLDAVASGLGVDFGSYLRQHSPYITTEQAGKLLSWGFALGSHSIDHPRYSEIPLDEQLRQTLESTRVLRSAFGLDYGLFAFPHSDGGVSSFFFERLAAAQAVDLTFGTRGLIEDSLSTNIQRMSFERPVAPVQRLLGRQLLRRLARRMKGLGPAAHPPGRP